MSLVSVENEEHLLKDTDTKCVINTNVSGLNRAKRIKEQKLRNERRLDDMERQLNEIKEMLLQLATR